MVEFVVGVEEDVSLIVVGEVEEEAFVDEIVDVSWGVDRKVFYATLHEKIFFNA